MTVADEVDFVIIGAGPAGCVVASRLSEEADSQVAVLECGGAGDDPRISVPGYAAVLPQSDQAWPAPTVPQQAASGRVVELVTGTGLGGGGSINAMGWFHGQPEDYDGWSAQGAEGWDWETMSSLLRGIEDHELGAGAFHGAGGPVSVTSPRHLHPVSLAFIRAGLQRGWPLSHDLNGSQRTGVALASVNVRDGARHSAAEAYLRPALGRANLALYTETRAVRIELSDRRATGVRWVQTEGREGGGQATGIIGARRGVILCAGAIATPQILMLSGIGPGAHLREHGLPVVSDLPAVGKFLQDHPAVPIPFALTHDASSTAPEPDPQEVYRLIRRGPLSASAQAVALVAAGDAACTADAPPELVIGLALVGAAAGLIDEDPPDAPSGVCVLGLIDPQSRGSVHLASNRIEDRPLVDPGYLQDGNDRPRLRNGVRMIQRLFETDALRSNAQPLIDQLGNDDEIDAYIDQTLATYYHPVGTARMGTGPDSAVSPALVVHGLESLWVADASVMPRIPRGLPHAPTLAIAEQAAKLIAVGRS